MFGACKSCQHLIREDKQQRCGLTGEALLKADLEKICVYHECD
jgi:RNA polymerase subunit RPABC4/transcription elongation factor Spt4